MTITRRSTRTALLALLLAALLAVLPACGGDDDDETDTAAGGDEPASLTVDGAWARTSPAVADAGAVYLVITNDGDTDDALVGAAVDPSVAARAEIHETVMAQTQTQAQNQNQGSMTTMGGSTPPMMEMREVESIAVPAGETVTLEPGGYHVMLLQLVEPLVAGERVELTLTFEEAGDIKVVAEVRDVAP